jgi:hypothetical protein
VTTELPEGLKSGLQTDERLVRSTTIGFWIKLKLGIRAAKNSGILRRIGAWIVSTSSKVLMDEELGRFGTIDSWIEWR